MREIYSLKSTFTLVETERPCDTALDLKGTKQCESHWNKKYTHGSFSVDLWSRLLKAVLVQTGNGHCVPFIE